MIDDGTALLGTSVLIAAEGGRPHRADRVPEAVVISVVTLAELHAGILAAPDTPTRTRRMRTLAGLGDIDVIDVDEATALNWAGLRVALAEAGRRLDVNDVWIAATAIRHSIPVVTQDGDFDVLAEIAGLDVIHV